MLQFLRELIYLSLKTEVPEIGKIIWRFSCDEIIIESSNTYPTLIENILVAIKKKYSNII